MQIRLHSLIQNKQITVHLNLCVTTKAMRLPKNFAISGKSKVESRIVSTVETGPKENRGFERPKLLRNLPKIFPKIRFETPVRKYTGILGSTYVIFS